MLFTVAYNKKLYKRVNKFITECYRSKILSNKRFKLINQRFVFVWRDQSFYVSCLTHFHSNNMERWSGKVAVVTGASSGIGAAIAVDLVKAGMKVVGLARRKDRVEALKKEIPSNTTGKLYAVECDITKDDDIVQVFDWILDELGGIDVLVNNAGCMKPMSLTDEGNEEILKKILQTNVWGLIMCTKKAVEIMRKKKIVGGHVVNINSICGHKVLNEIGKPLSNVYPASKFAITALTEVFRQEFAFEDMKMKVTVRTF